MCETIAEDEKRMAKKRERRPERKSESEHPKQGESDNKCMHVGRQAKEVTLKCNNNCRKNTNVNRKVACTRQSNVKIAMQKNKENETKREE